MGQSRKSQDAVEAIRLQDRVIEKSIRPPPVERFGPPVPFFSSNAFCKFGSDGSRYEEPAVSATSQT